MARDIAQAIVRRVTAIDENKSVLEAAIVMTEKFIGSVVITGSSGICGIFTERDLMSKVVGKRKNPEDVTIKNVMVKDRQISSSPSHMGISSRRLVRRSLSVTLRFRRALMAFPSTRRGSKVWSSAE